jgi:tRNA1(Val) A37 N6-methylase TrmN6
LKNIELNDLYDYVPLKIYQNNEYFKFSLDSVLIAEYIKNPEKIHSILELCAGNCAISMILSTKTKAKITAVELQKEIFELGEKSIEYNNLSKQINLICSDINNIENYFPGNNFDIIVCNPPYFDTKSSHLTNKEKIKAIARHEINLKLEDIFKISSKILDLNGELYIVHKPERLDEIIIFANKYNINVKNIQFVTTKPNDKPKLVLVRCIKGSHKNIKIDKDICIENLKTFKNIFWRE